VRGLFRVSVIGSLCSVLLGCEAPDAAGAPTAVNTVSAAGVNTAAVDSRAGGEKSDTFGLDVTPRRDSGAASAAAPLAATAEKPAKLGLCAACHGKLGRATLPSYPNLAGQNQSYLASALRAYQSGERQNAQMRSMVGSLSESDIEALSQYYSALTPVPPPNP
jgi:cytochrome c553